MHDICIIGVGTAGAFALQKILTEDKNAKVIVFDAGRPGLKRRHQVFGFLGCLPGSDGKLYISDLNTVYGISGAKKTNNAKQWVSDQLNDIIDLKYVKASKPSINLQKKIKKNNYDITLHDFYQLYPKNIHALSRQLVSQMEANTNLVSSFDNEVLNIFKHKNHFIVLTSAGEFSCKKVLLSAGRGGWRWAGQLFQNFGLTENNNETKFGIRAEISNSCMQEFNGSSCSLQNNDIEIGPIGWNGTTIPEDHIDIAISAFRSNEQRWHTDKASFNIIKTLNFEDYGYQQAERLSKLTFILGNDRMSKEKLSTLAFNKSKFSVIEEYKWIPQELQRLNGIVPDLIEKGMFYVPTIIPLAPQINIHSDFSTDIKGLYCAGESANVPGLYGAMLSGAIVADALMKN